MSTNHARYKLAIGHNIYGILQDHSHLPEGQKIENFHDKDKRLKEAFRNIKILLLHFP